MSINYVKINGWACISYTHIANKSPNSTCPCRILLVQVFGWKWRAIIPFDPSSKSVIQSRVATQSSLGLEGPLVNKINITKALARGNAASNFPEDHWPKAVASGQAHWSAEHHGRPTSETGHRPSPLEWSFLETSLRWFKVPPGLTLLVRKKTGGGR